MIVLRVAGGPELMTWPPDARRRCAGEPAVSGDVMVADGTVSDENSRAIADVIYHDRLCTCPLAWLDTTLRDYPGCAVAAARAGSGYLAAGRAARLCPFPFAVRNGPGQDLLAGALFLHGWLAAGWPLDALNPPVLVGPATLRDSAWRSLSPSGAPIAFALFHGCPESSSSSRRRASAASWAPVSE